MLLINTTSFRLIGRRAVAIPFLLFAVNVVAFGNLETRAPTIACPQNCTCDISSSSLNIDCTSRLAIVVSMTHDVSNSSKSGNDVGTRIDVIASAETNNDVSKSSHDYNNVRELLKTNGISTNMHQTRKNDVAQVETSPINVVREMNASIQSAAWDINLNKSLPLLEDINRILMTIKTTLTDLSIKGCRELTEVPSELCNSLQLRSVYLNNNKLERLPDNCFVRLRQLETLNVHDNVLAELQDGLFDGLTKLRFLNFQSNQIKSIGLHLFANATDLPSLSEINLDNNQLTSVEPWPYIQAAAKKILISLRCNRIRKFTNVLGWRLVCRGDKANRSQIRLTENTFEHIWTLIEDLNFTTVVQYMCFAEQVIISWSSSKFICDCEDYYFYNVAKFSPEASALTHLYCINIIAGFHNSPAGDVPLDQIVCEIFKDKGCPAGCKCFNQPSKATFKVLCPNLGLTELPGTVPPTSIPRTLFSAKWKELYMLDFSGNSIGKLEARDYFKNSTYVDVSNSSLEYVTEKALVALEKVKKIYLHNNMLKTLPPAILNLSFTFENLGIYNNPISCGCDQLWFKGWLESVYDRLENPTAIHCGSPVRLRGKNIFAVNDTDFCNEPPQQYPEFDTKALIIAAVVPVILTCLIIALLLRFRVKVYSALGVHPFDRDECEGEAMTFDVFLSFAHDDGRQALEILEFLERNSLKVCYHQRDFIPGNSIIENIDDAIRTSKRVLCLVTENFLASQYGLEEFERALHHTVSIKRRRLIVIMSETNFKFPILTGEFDDAYVGVDGDDDDDDVAMLSGSDGLVGENTSRLLSPSVVANDSRIIRLKDFTERNTYIDMCTSTWKENLLYSMPLDRLGQAYSEILE